MLISNKPCGPLRKSIMKQLSYVPSEDGTPRVSHVVIMRSIPPCGSRWAMHLTGNGRCGDPAAFHTRTLAPSLNAT
jgi:hypothetical protein